MNVPQFKLRLAQLALLPFHQVFVTRAANFTELGAAVVATSKALVEAQQLDTGVTEAEQAHLEAVDAWDTAMAELEAVSAEA
jgi:hypothetical protein